MKDIRQTSPYSKYLESENWEVKKIYNNFYYIKNLGFYKLIKLQRPAKISRADIETILRQYKGIIEFIVEPKNYKQTKLIESLGFKQTKPYVPSKTIYLDLKKSEKSIYESFKKDTRYSIRKAENIELKTEDDMQKFHNIWKSSVPRGRYVLSVKQLTSLNNIFTSKALFLLDRKFDAGAVFLEADSVGYYWYGFTDKSTRKSLAMYKIVWEGIKWCKSKGAKSFDFEGIYDERFPIKGWRGFTDFKKKFGGKVVEFPGAFKKKLLKYKVKVCAES